MSNREVNLFSKGAITKLAAKAKPVNTSDIYKLKDIARHAILSDELSDLAVYIIGIHPYYRSLGYKETLRMLEISEL